MSDPSRRRPGLFPGEIVLLGLWMGLLAGFGEVLKLAVQRFVLHGLLFREVDVVWAAPLALAILVTLAALPLALLARARPGSAYSALPFVLLGFIALYSFTVDLPEVHPLGRLILAAGIAIQAGRWAARRAGTVVGLARRTVIPLLGLILVLPLGIRGVQWANERRGLAGLPAANPEAPNVLWLVLDTVGAIDLSLYGYTRPTSPTLDRLGAQGVVFNQAFVPSSWTLATHAAFFTGHLPFETGVGWRTALDDTYPTLAEVLRGRGYATAGFSANHLYMTRATGLSRGFTHFEGSSPTMSLLVASTLARTVVERVRTIFQAHEIPGRKSTGQLRQAVLAWLGRAPKNRPYFVFINAFDAHGPYLPPPPFDTAFTGKRTSWKERNPVLNNLRPMTPGEVVPTRDAYDQAIAAQDHQIGLLLESLERAGLLRNTLIIVTSDHGEEFAERGLLGHGQSLNPSLLWVPLVFVLPGGGMAGVRFAEPVSLLDLPATILALADPAQSVELPGTPLFQREGRNVAEPRSLLVAELVHPLELPAWSSMSDGPLRALTLSGWHYVRETGGKETLLDIRTDPAGRLLDLNSPAVRAVLPRYRALLDSLSPPGAETTSGARSSTGAGHLR